MAGEVKNSIENSCFQIENFAVEIFAVESFAVERVCHHGAHHCCRPRSRLTPPTTHSEPKRPPTSTTHLVHHVACLNRLQLVQHALALQLRVLRQAQQRQGHGRGVWVGEWEGVRPAPRRINARSTRLQGPLLARVARLGVSPQHLQQGRSVTGVLLGFATATAGLCLGAPPVPPPGWFGGRGRGLPCGCTRGRLNPHRAQGKRVCGDLPPRACRSRPARRRGWRP
jgi:hypothetical protein